MKVLQINPVVRATTSTGRIMQQIGEKIVARGWQSYIAFSGARDRGPDGAGARSVRGLIEGCRSKELRIGRRFDLLTHFFETRLLDRHGLSSTIGTKKFVSNLHSLSPDLIHIHNLHGYYINYSILFEYLRETGIPVIWTLHDCWAYTGHCYYYSAVGCERWKSGCHNCPQRTSFPKSWFYDRSAQNYADKAEAFNSLAPGQLTLVCVSEWMRGEIGHSFLRDIDCKVIHNGVDTGIFFPKSRKEIEETRSLYSLPYDKKIILAVAAGWTPHKGGDDLLNIASLLSPDEILLVAGKINSGLLAGLQRQGRMPANIMVLDQISNLHALANLYSASDIFINPTYQDNFPTVNLEAQACGIPVVTYGSGGSGESIVKYGGDVVEKGDFRSIVKSVRSFYPMDRNSIRDICRENIMTNYRADSQFDSYLVLYQSKLFNQ